MLFKNLISTLLGMFIINFIPVLLLLGGNTKLFVIALEMAFSVVLFLCVRFVNMIIHEQKKQGEFLDEVYKGIIEDYEKEAFNIDDTTMDTIKN